MRTKLTNNRGDSIIEALVSLLIAVLSIAFLVASITAAIKINEKNQAQVTNELSFSYVQTGGTNLASDSNANITFAGDSDLTTEIDVKVYTTDNGYSYYEMTK